MINMPRNIILALAVVSLLVAACGGVTGGNPVTSKTVSVVATFSVLGDIVQNVGGDKIDVQVLVGPGIDTHTFEPSPADNRTLSGAALIFENGLGFETWLDDLYTASGSQAKRIVVTEGLELLQAERNGLGHEHGEFDPHVWHSVADMISEVKLIRDALAQADPANAAVYQANAEAYLAQLQELDTWIFTEVNRLPADRRKLVTMHDTFGYFARRYGFAVIGALLPTTTEGASPSAQEVAALVEAVKAARVPAVFAENVSSNALLRQVADEAGVKVVASLYTDALGPPQSEGDTYLDMMRYNVTTIVSELGK